MMMAGLLPLKDWNFVQAAQAEQRGKPRKSQQRCVQFFDF
jgi:hypothetical protein